LRFSRKRQNGLRKIFSRFRRKYLFLTNCIEKHYTRL